MFPGVVSKVRLAASARIISSRHLRGFVSTTTPTLEKHTMKVPTMGDSITEGTIVEWTALIGQMVKEGDVVALVETDKVTVDIKAEIDGVVTQQFGEVDETVEVGASLYEIDTEAEASVVAAAPSEPDSPPPVPMAEPVASLPPVESSIPAPQRVPSIKFLGKEGWAQLLSGQSTAVVYHIPPNYGRLKFSDDEMEALMTGGANIAPEVKQHSSGALFG